MSLIDIGLRLVVAMLIGMVVGGQRTMTAHPAGIRTHTLVCVGACVVMITSCMIFQEVNSAVGGTPDPARMGAQVVSGIGFLGAGTILREGLSVRGLTTAASLWAVACLGLATGVGYFSISLMGTVIVFITLTFFNVLQEKLVRDGNSTFELQIECRSQSPLVLNALDELCRRHESMIANMSFRSTRRGTFLFNVLIRQHTPDRDFVKTQFMKELSMVEGVVNVEHSA